MPHIGLCSIVVLHLCLSWTPAYVISQGTTLMAGLECKIKWPLEWPTVTYNTLLGKQTLFQRCLDTGVLFRYEWYPEVQNISLHAADMCRC